MVVKTRQVEEQYNACELCDKEIVRHSPSDDNLVLMNLFSSIKSMNPNAFESFNIEFKETPFFLCKECYANHKERLGTALYNAYLNEITLIKEENSK